MRLVDDTWRGGRRTRLVAEIRQLTGAIESGRPVTHLVYAAATATTPAIFHPEPSFAEELVEFDDTNKIFTSPTDRRTQDYITGRFG